MKTAFNGRVIPEAYVSTGFDESESIMLDHHAVDDSKEAKLQRRASLQHHIEIDQHNIHCDAWANGRDFDQEAIEQREYHSQAQANRRLREVIKSQETLRGRAIGVDPWNRITDEQAAELALSDEVLAILNEGNYTPQDILPPLESSVGYDKAVTVKSPLKWKQEYGAMLKGITSLKHWQNAATDDSGKLVVESGFNLEAYNEHKEACIKRRHMQLLAQCGLTVKGRPDRARLSGRAPNKTASERAQACTREATKAAKEAKRLAKEAAWEAKQVK